MPTHLRLHTEQPSQLESDAAAPYPFPVAKAEARRTLVAGVVQVPANPEPLMRSRHSWRTGVLAHIEGGVDRTTDTDRLMREVECTLNDMQTTLDDLKEDIDQVFKFPEMIDDDRPWAA